jgi:carboxy-cis,cis-muconate cyclase
MLLPLAASVAPAFADTHYLFSGFFSGTTVVGLEFDDATSALTVVNNITTTATGSKWIALGVCQSLEKQQANDTGQIH